MPINPNIALGVQPQPQPVNMLGQLGQLYALKAARQEVEGGEAVRDFFSKGGDLSTPEGQRQIMTAAPKLGGQLIKQQADIRKVQIDTLKDEIGLRRDALANVRTPEDYLAWHDANHTGQLGAFFKSAGINPSRESIMAELAKPGGLDRLVRGSALGATKLQQELMQTERTYGAASISAAPGHARNALEREKYRDQLAGGGDVHTVTVTDPETNEPIEVLARRDLRTGQLIPMSVQQPPISVNVSPSSATSTITPPAVGGGGATSTNALAPTPAPSVNTLAPNAVTGSPAGSVVAPTPAPTSFARPKASAPTLTEVDDPANPGQKLRVDARIYKQGGTLGDPGVLGVARTEKLTPAQTLKLKTEMGKDFKVAENAIASTNELLESIDAVRSSDLKAISGPIAGRTPSAKEASLTAESRIENLKGKVTALGKASAAMTGAIGSIANQEWKILADQIAVLDLTKGEKAVSEQIDRLENMARGTVNRIRDAYERQYSEHFDLAPQYREVPNITYTPGKYTRTGRATSGVDSSNPWLK